MLADTRTYWTVRMTCLRKGDVGMQLGPVRVRHGERYVSLVFSDGLIQGFPLRPRTDADWFSRIRDMVPSQDGFRNRLEKLPGFEGDTIFCILADMNGMPRQEISEYFGIPLDKLALML